MHLYVVSAISLLMVLLVLPDTTYSHGYRKKYNYRYKYYNKVAKVDCGPRGYLSYISTPHNYYYHGNRRWDYRCREALLGACSWSGHSGYYYYNHGSSPEYTCPGDSVVSGIHSYYNYRRGIRNLKFRCCHVVGKKTNKCYYTDIVNPWGRYLKVLAAPGKVIKGAVSYNNNKRWKFYLCDLYY